MYGIADLDNCYCSCEKVFRPDLEGKPIVVLSNNDGCVVARSNDAKKMGNPFKSSLFSKSVGYEALQKKAAASKQRIKEKSLAEPTKKAFGKNTDKELGKKLTLMGYEHKHLTKGAAYRMKER